MSVERRRKVSQPKDRQAFRPRPSAWRKIETSAGKVAPWLAELGDASGCYLIRRPEWLGHELVYIGESHTGRLRKAILRHFQAPQKDHPDHYYDRARAEVRVILTPARKAIPIQYALIQRYKPRDNEIEGTSIDLDDVPF